MQQTAFSSALVPACPQINRHFDNIDVAQDGAMYATALTHILEFKAAGADAGMSGLRPPVEVYRISNNTLAEM